MQDEQVALFHDIIHPPREVVLAWLTNTMTASWPHKGKKEKVEGKCFREMMHTLLHISFLFTFQW